jgi:ribokinase
MTAAAGRDPRRVVVSGQIARDLVLRVYEMPCRGSSALVAERVEVLGGKGANQAVGLSQLGMDVTLIGAVGDDDAADRMLVQAAGDGIDVSLVARRTGTSTALITSVVEAGGWRYFEDIPDATLVSATDVAHAAEAIGAASTVVIQLQQTPDAALAAARLGRAAGCRVVIDGAPADSGYRDQLLAEADVVRADDREAELLAGHPIRSGAAAVAAGQEILRSGPSLVALAAGPDGNAVVWPEGSLVIPLDDAPVVDTTGAGDAFVAALVASLAGGLDPAESGRRAAAAAGRTVQHAGGRPRLR